MNVNFMHSICSELNEKDKSTLFDIVTFAKILKQYYKLKNFNNEIEQIKEVGFILEPSSEDDPDTDDVLDAGFKACESALDKVKSGMSSENNWDLTWDEYYMFNSIINKGNAIKHLIELRHKGMSMLDKMTELARKNDR